MAKKYTIGAGIVLEGEQQFKKAVKDINSDLSVLSKEMTLVSEKFSDNANSIEALTAKQEIYDKKIAAQKEKVNVLTQALEAVKKEYGENSTEVNKWASQLLTAETALIKTEKEARKIKDVLDFNNAAESIKNLNVVNNSLNEQAAAFDKAEKSVKDYDQSLDNANKTTVTFGDLVKANFLGDVISSAFHKAADAAGDFIKQGITLASDLTEVQNVVDVTFGDGAAQIYEWADAAAESFGMSSLLAQQYNGTMGAMLKSMGLTDDKVKEMSMDMVGLAGDMASFYNIDIERAFEKIRAGISGETEPLKQLGINMSVANLEAYALSQGIETAYKNMTEAEKATLRYNYLMSVTADAQGDFARTSDSYANQQRILELQTQNLAASFGEKLLPMVNDLTGSLNENMPQIGEKIDTVGNIVVGLFDFVIDNHETILSVITGIGAALAAQKGAKVVGDVTSAVKDLFSTVKSGQGVMSALAASLNTQPWVLAVGAIAAVTAGLVALASQAFKTSTALKDAAEESVQAYEDEKTKVAELEAELDGVNQKIDDIKSKGKLSFTEAEELANLKLQNGELSTQLEIEKKILETKKRQAEYDLYNAVTNEDTAEEGTIAYIEDRIQAYEEVADYIKTLQEELNEAIANGNELLAEDLREKMRPFEEAATEEELRIEESTAALNKLAENLDLTTESGREAKAAVDDLVKKVSEMFDITESEKELISSDIMDPYAADSALSATGKYFETQGKLAVEAAEKKKAAREQALKDYVADLDEKQDLRRISEEDYYNELYDYLMKYEDRESVEWFKQLGRYEDYRQKLADAAEKAAEDEQKAEKERQNAAKKAADEAETERINAIKKSWDNISRLKERGKIDDEKEYKLKAQLVKDYCDENEDTWDDYYKWLYDYTKNKEDEIEELRLKNLEDSTKKQADRLEKAYADIKSKKEQVKKDLQSIDLTDTVKGKDGKDVLILNDLDAEIKKIDKYEASMAKLRASGISDSLVSEIEKLNYANGDRQDYINTLLSLPADKLQQYYNDWNKLQARQESAANLAVEEELEETNKEAEKAISSTNEMLDRVSKSAYEKGAETAKNFFRGLTDSMNGLNDTETINAVFRSGYADRSGMSVRAKETLTTAQNVISADTPIKIFIDRQEAIETTLWKILDAGSRSGGNVLHL